MAPVVVVFSTRFVAGAAFMRVDPVSTSGPTLGRISTSQVPVSSCGGSEQDTRPVTAPSVCARDSAARTNGVVPLAAMPRTKSRGSTRSRSIAAAPASTSSSAPSWLFTSAGRPPAMTPTTSSGGVPKVGGHSLASSRPRRPDAPAPTPSGAAAPAAPSPGLAPVAGPATARTTSRALIASGWPLTGRAKPVASRQAMVVSGHPLASDVGVEILRRGGNAVDAAVAVAFALSVVEPVAGNIGGGGFMLIRDPDGTVRALDYREAAPRRATRGMYVDSTGKPAASSLTGHLSVAVPGSVAGLWEAHRKYGKLPWKDLVAPAIILARDGHVLDGPRSHQIAREASRLARFPASRAQFLRNGEAPPAGTRFVQAELAHTLELIADSGPKVFYRGPIAELPGREMERGGGLIARDDL